MSIGGAFYKVGLVRGARHEDRALEALRTYGVPWIKSVRHADDSEERRGIDIVVETDVGKIFVQVKSSRRGLAGHREKHGRSRTRILVVIVNEGMTNLDVANIVRGFVTRERQVIMNHRKSFWK